MTSYVYPYTETRVLRDLDYLIRINAIHARFYGRLARHSRLIELLGASAAICGVISDFPTLTVLAGILIAFVAYANIAFDFAGGTRMYQAVGNGYLRLKAEMQQLNLDEIDRRRHLIGEDAPNYIEALRVPCFNEVMRNHGLEKEQRPLSWWQSFMQAIA